MMKQDEKKCSVCLQNESKYKCPACRAPYCCVACCKKHKEGDLCQPPPPTSFVEPETKIKIDTTPSTTFLHPTADTISLEQLQQLEKSEALKSILTNPHLQTILQHLDTSKDPKSAIEDAMQEPLFVEFADACMKVVDSNE